MTAIQGARPSQVADILDICIPLRKPLSLIGPPGLGKSALVKQAAARLAEADHDAELIRRAGFDPEDEELTVYRLARDWGEHPAGAPVVCGLVVEGYPFAVIEEN